MELINFRIAALTRRDPKQFEAVGIFPGLYIGFCTILRLEDRIIPGIPICSATLLFSNRPDPVMLSISLPFHPNFRPAQAQAQKPQQGQLQVLVQEQHA